MDVDSPMERELHQQNQQLEKQDSPPGTGRSSSPPVQQQVAPDGQVQAQTAVVGPKCALPYSVVNAIIEKNEDGPGPRCGHTLTAVGRRYAWLFWWCHGTRREFYCFRSSIIGWKRWHQTNWCYC